MLEDHGHAEAIGEIHTFNSDNEGQAMLTRLRQRRGEVEDDLWGSRHILTIMWEMVMGSMAIAMI